MKATISLQKHLVYGLTLGITLLRLVAVAVCGLAVQHELNETFDNAMQETAQRLPPLAVLDILNSEGGQHASAGLVAERETRWLYVSCARRARKYAAA